MHASEKRREEKRETANKQQLAWTRAQRESGAQAEAGPIQLQLILAHAQSHRRERKGKEEL